MGALASAGAQLVSGLLNTQAALALVPMSSAGGQSGVGAFSSGFGNGSSAPMPLLLLPVQPLALRSHLSEPARRRLASPPCSNSLTAVGRWYVAGPLAVSRSLRTCMGSAGVGKVENAPSSPAVGPGGSPPEAAGQQPWNIPGPRQDSVASIEGNPPPPPRAASPPPPSPLATAIADSPIGEAVQRVFGSAQRGLREFVGSGVGNQGARGQHLRKSLPRLAL